MSSEDAEALGTLGIIKIALLLTSVTLMPMLPQRHDADVFLLSWATLLMKP